jgi:hypothetical protein
MAEEYRDSEGEHQRDGAFVGDGAKTEEVETTDFY